MENIDIVNYADDNTPFSTRNNLNEVLHDLQSASEIIFEWFKNNGMKSNPEKSHLLLSEKNNIETQICSETIRSSKCVKLLGIKVDGKLTFDEHIETICNKASQNVNALARISRHL